MAMTSTATVAELLDALHVPPQRVLLRPVPGEATEDDLLHNPRLCELIDGVLVEKTMGWWEVDPERRTVEIFASPDESTVLDENATLDGGAVLPGFSVPIRQWFARAGHRI